MMHRNDATIYNLNRNLSISFRSADIQAKNKKQKTKQLYKILN